MGLPDTAVSLFVTRVEYSQVSLVVFAASSNDMLAFLCSFPVKSPLKLDLNMESESS